MEYRTLVEAVLAHAKERPQRLAVAFKTTQLDYSTLCRRMEAIAALLARRYGVCRGDHVAISAVSKPEYVAALLGAQYLGAVTLPLDKSAKPAAAAACCQAGGAKLVLTDADFGDGAPPAVSLKALYEQAAASAEDTPPYAPPAPDELAEILFTTGTTGAPKAAMLPYNAVLANMHNTWHGMGMRPDDCVLLPLPLNHSFGMRVLRTALYVGASVVLQNGFTFGRMLEQNIERYHCTAMAGVSASIAELFDQMQERFAHVLGGLRYIEISAGALPVDMRKKLVEALPNTAIHNTWGSTETGGALFLNVSAHPEKLFSAGRPLEGIELKVVDEQGSEKTARDAGSAGRMALRGAMQMAGYYGQPELTAQTLVDGWLYTKDLVYTDDEGYVYMIGRADDIINVGGEKVSPAEVEQTARGYDGIRDCACIGVEDPDGSLGRVPVLYVVSDGKLDEQGLHRYLMQRLERYKLPHRYIRVAALPRNAMQKLDRKALQALWEQMGDRALTNPVIDALMTRRSIRDFTAEPVPKAYLDVILQTGIHAPSGHNMQTWQFTVLQDKEKIERLKETTKKAAAENKVYFYGFNAPAAVIIISNDRRSRFKYVDSACAAENMMLAAHSLGLGSVWINALSGLCDVPEVRSLLDRYGVPQGHTVVCALALGYPAAAGKLLAKKQNVIHWA